MRKYPAKIYAKALSDVLEKDLSKKEAETVLANFLALVEKNQDQKGLSKIYQLTEKSLLKKMGINKIIFESAREIESKNFKRLKEAVDKKDICEERTNKELLAGVKIIKNGNEQIDYS
ncbi:MAG: F0F1 ATP synthase subunit delta, partial [Patescibacteria group bacterium]